METYSSLKRQRRIDFAKRIATALVAAQEFKNELDDALDVMRASLSDTSKPLSVAVRLAVTKTVNRMESDYKTAGDILGGMEQVAIIIERRGSISTIDEAAIEAKLGRLKQTQLLAKFDAKSLAGLVKANPPQGSAEGQTSSAREVG